MTPNEQSSEGRGRGDIHVLHAVILQSLTAYPREEETF